MDPSYRFKVTGRVQGVRFRQSAAEQARLLQVRGWIRNRPDGAVEGSAAGDAAALEQFRQWLAHGPSMARVADVTWLPASGEDGAGFEVRR